MPLYYTGMPHYLVNRFFTWYERNLTTNTAIVAVLFTWQLTHLYWLTTHVVTARLFGLDLFPASPSLQFLVIIADYAEIPALLGATALYLSRLRKHLSRKDLFYLVLVNSQWLHILWITDEFVVDVFSGANAGLPLWLAAIAIGIDYLELPVIYDTLKQTFRNIRQRA
jgi:hypothetical protein